MKRLIIFLTGVLLTASVFAQTQKSSETFTDNRDGNVYHTVIIGDQIWMAENLKYLPSVSHPSTGSKTKPHYYVNGYEGTVLADAKETTYYANRKRNNVYDTYGVLYNWTAAMAGQASSETNPRRVQGVCPDGWHLPSDEEWVELTDFLDGKSVAGGKLKEAGLKHWVRDSYTTKVYNERTDETYSVSMSDGATNETGFTGLPGGNRHSSGNFSPVGEDGYWWSATQYDTDKAWMRSLTSVGRYISRRAIDKELGLSVRCVKD